MLVQVSGVGSVYWWKNTLITHDRKPPPLEHLVRAP